MKEPGSRKRKRGRKRQPQNQHSKTITKHGKQTLQHQPSASPSSKPPKSSTFLDKMRARLSGGHFRMLNEKLYTCTGKEALNYFSENPSSFDMYHSGYQEQMSHWPELPVNKIAEWLKGHSPSLVVADFGCGDARLAKNVKNKVFSFDLVSNDPSVIACDMSNTPLDSSSVDVAVFCLSLMGTNFPSYLQEAHRVLKPNGWLLIAEVKSRFDPNTGGADPKEFSNAVCNLGFASELKDLSNKMFILLHFKKKVSSYFITRLCYHYHFQFI
ncbi:ribosomal RNA-processing protein 8 [Pistacia vera]|uniref:ribosomal RNA-processing protein 8 n=1 Tax=Pistacia vera TaxID=55513 RepID=UPI001263B756|nr:ribosomal RNA-processing protein 8 [Pistacia vera]